MRAILPFFASVFAIGTGLSSAATISFQQGVSPSSSYSHLGQDFRGKDNQVNTGNVMSVGYQSGGVLQIRGILGFDLSAIPVGATIDSITLVMTVAETGAGSVTNLGSIELREVTPNGTAANNMVAGQTNWTFWKTDTAWTTPGGDFGNILASASVDSFTNGQTVIFSSSLLLAAAQASFNAGSPLELILIAPTAEAGSGTHLVRFGSDDNANTSYRPLLTVNYTIPEPSSAGLLSLGVVGFFARRKR